MEDVDIAAAPKGESIDVCTKNASHLWDSLHQVSSLLDAWNHHQRRPADELATLNHGQNNLEERHNLLYQVHHLLQSQKIHEISSH